MPERPVHTGEIMVDAHGHLQLPCLVGDGGFLPTRSKVGDAGLDLRVPADVPASVLEPGGTITFDTRVRVAIPPRFCGQVWGRSGLGAGGIHARLATDPGGEFAPPALGGLVDSGYRGPIKVTLAHLGPVPVAFAPGDRIAQLVIVPYLHLEPLAVEALDATERGEGGLGSTGR